MQDIKVTHEITDEEVHYGEKKEIINHTAGRKVRSADFYKSKYNHLFII